jgi:hypothetical protein
VFFFEKRTKKLLPFASAAGSVRDSRPKVFCFFSSEKKTVSHYDGATKKHLISVAPLRLGAGVDNDGGG